MKALIFDTEATDLVTNTLLRESHQPRIVEFAGKIVEDDGSERGEFHFMCNPGVTIPDKVTEITGIANADVAEQPYFEHYAPEMADFFAQADAVVAHNLSYDWFVVNHELDRVGQTMMWPNIRICTVEETEWFKGFRLNLSALHEHLFGEAFSGAHRAKEDVDALARCYLKLRETGDL